MTRIPTAAEVFLPQIEALEALLNEYDIADKHLLALLGVEAGIMPAVRELQAENERLRSIVKRVSESNDVAKAYQEVYFEDERSWKQERTRRIEAEARITAAITELIQTERQGADLQDKQEGIIETLRILRACDTPPRQDDP